MESNVSSSIQGVMFASYYIGARVRFQFPNPYFPNISFVLLHWLVEIPFWLLNIYRRIIYFRDPMTLTSKIAHTFSFSSSNMVLELVYKYMYYKTTAIIITWHSDREANSLGSYENGLNYNSDHFRGIPLRKLLFMLETSNSPGFFQSVRLFEKFAYYPRLFDYAGWVCGMFDTYIIVYVAE